MEDVIYTVGHSTHSQERFIALLQSHGVTAVSDVRSKPYSRVNPQFNREELKKALRDHGISYVFLGKELGARSDDSSCYENGKVQYDRLAKTPLFQSALDRIRGGREKHRIALMCAEKEPLDCHRTILVARHLVAAGAEVQHIHANGSLESQGEALERLMRQLGVRDADMFRSQADLEREAYEKQEQRIAYTTTPTEPATVDFEKSVPA
jgi:uncharacterized protein (DUF488 family)